MAVKIIKELGTKKQWQVWCKENDFTLEELEEFFNNAIKYAKLQNNEKLNKSFFRKRD